MLHHYHLATWSDRVEFNSGAEQCRERKDLSVNQGQFFRCNVHVISPRCVTLNHSKPRIAKKYLNDIAGGMDDKNALIQEIDSQVAERQTLQNGM